MLRILQRDIKLLFIRKFECTFGSLWPHALRTTSLTPATPFIVQETETRQPHLSDHQLATVLSTQMTKHIFRSRKSVTAVQLNTPQKLRDPGPKPSALLCVFNILKSQNTDQIEGSKEHQTRKAQVYIKIYMKRILTPKPPI